MNLGDLQFYDIVIFAGIAAFLIFRLRKILGKRTGFEKNRAGPRFSSSPIEKKTPNKTIPELEENFSELKTAYETLEQFDHKSFLEGAKLAFETIIKAFNKGDKKTLKNLLTEDVYKAFEEEINKKNIDSESQIFSLNIKNIKNVVINKNTIIIKVVFVSEMFKNNDESTVIKNEDTWSFEKPIKSNNPNWLLSST